MAPIGPGLTVGAIFVFEKNTLPEFAAAGRGGASGSTLCGRYRVEERMRSGVALNC